MSDFETAWDRGGGRRRTDRRAIGSLGQVESLAGGNLDVLQDGVGALLDTLFGVGGRGERAGGSLDEITGGRGCGHEGAGGSESEELKRAHGEGEFWSTEFEQCKE